MMQSTLERHLFTASGSFSELANADAYSQNGSD